jgi:hypothetical protein
LDRFGQIARARYAVGKRLQPDVLKAQVEVCGLVQQLELLQQKKLLAEARIRVVPQRVRAGYGLRVDNRVDERVDPVKSTGAAARYLRDLYEIFNDWPLVLAAYNAGENRILKLIERNRMHRFTEMADRGLLPAETILYVPFCNSKPEINTKTWLLRMQTHALRRLGNKPRPQTRRREKLIRRQEGPMSGQENWKEATLNFVKE